MGKEKYVMLAGIPTFAVVSVRELRVVDFPEEGLPTRPISGSRGILDLESMDQSGLSRRSVVWAPSHSRG
jgi:hypothetical protein